MIDDMCTLDEKILSHTEIGIYLDFYGKLLTRHSRDMLEAYYGEDMSLSEIAENMGITRQAVYDRIRQGTSQLLAYEQALGLGVRFQSTRRMVRAALDALDQGQTDQVRETLCKLENEL